MVVFRVVDVEVERRLVDVRFIHFEMLHRPVELRLLNSKIPFPEIPNDISAVRMKLLYKLLWAAELGIYCQAFSFSSKRSIRNTARSPEFPYR